MIGEVARVRGGNLHVLGRARVETVDVPGNLPIMFPPTAAPAPAPAPVPAPAPALDPALTPVEIPPAPELHHGPDPTPRDFCSVLLIFLSYPEQHDL
eukprot:18343-Amorphochlora_amoeboformis.AAC.1